ncbi:MAG: peptidoglycan DD-metalloendopeptidase family protein [Cyclobacteriaceae bacterium]
MSVRDSISSLVIILLLLFSIPLSAQNRKDLEKEKAENLQKIQEAEKILEQTESEKVVSLGQLKALNRQIKVREDLIRSISSEIKYLTGEITEISIVIEALENDLEQLKKEYASMIYSAYKTKSGVNKLTFLFSADNFNQFLLRLKYMEQYADMRKVQVEQIGKVRDALASQRVEGENKKKEQSALLSEQIKENEKLLSLKNKQTNLVAQLNNKQKELKSEVDTRKKAIDNLDKLIADIIRREMEAASPVDINVAELSESFEKNQAKLPWPAAGFIASEFGRHPHPVLKGIMVENQGVDIQTQRDEQVKAVFEGEVVTVAFVPGMNNVVIIKHGEYYTLYAKMKLVSVKKGDKIETAQSIGEVFTDNDGISELQFQVWRNQNKMDPAKWLVAQR